MKDDARTLSIVQEIMSRSTHYLATHHRACGGARRRDDVILVPTLQHFSRWKTTFGGSPGEKGVTLGGGGASMVTIEEIEQQTLLFDEKHQYLNGEGAMEAQETRIGSLQK